MKRWRRQSWAFKAARAAAIVAAALGCTAEAAAQIPCAYEVTHIIQAPFCDPLGWPPTIGGGISPSGRYICGFYNQCIIGASRAFVYDTTTKEFMTLPLGPGFTSSSASDVNDAGIVCGNGIKSDVGDRGFVYDLNTGVWTELPSQNGTIGWSWANAINSKNEICGRRSLDDGGDPGFPWNAFLWTPRRGFADLGLIERETTEARDINELGFSTGTMASKGVNVPFLWTNSRLQELPTLTGMETVPDALNNRNQVVGKSLVPNPQGSGTVNHGFLAEVDSIIDLGVLAGFQRSLANDINDSSVVVGLCRTNSPWQVDHGFVWHDGIMRDLNDLISDQAVEVSNGLAISLAGRIVCSGPNGVGGIRCIILDPVPASPADIHPNCRVDVDDLLLVIDCWGRANSPADINRDSAVDEIDLEIVLKEWTFE